MVNSGMVLYISLFFSSVELVFFLEIINPVKLMLHLKEETFCNELYLFVHDMGPRKGTFADILHKFINKNVANITPVT